MGNREFDIDFDRKSRLGFPEVIFGQSKTIMQLKDILLEYVDKGKSALVTKLQEEKATELKKYFPEAFYDNVSGIFRIGSPTNKASEGEVAIVSGGTSDAFIVNEIYHTLHYLGTKAERIQDVGVSALHRLLNRLDDLKTFRVVIAVAGFEAALPTVLGGLISNPIIGVPTSVGYGVSKDGFVALNSLLASCANGITVVNIDNGYGAALAAFRILETTETNQKKNEYDASLVVSE
ncbi:MAG: nickel pincer cofactor biosynthesis protein LarB [Cyclobacteriaceae bacterium]